MPVWILTGVLILLAAVFFTGNRSVITLIRLQREVQALETEKQALEDENARLKETIERLQNDPDFIEEQARLRYNLKHEDEDVFKVTPK